MHKELEKKLIQAMGINDGPKFIALMDELEVSEIELSGYWVSIPVNQIANISDLQKKLSSLSVVGRDFPIHIKDEKIRIDIESADFNNLRSFHNRQILEMSCLVIDSINAMLRLFINTNKLAASVVGILVLQKLQENKIPSEKNVVSNIKPGFFKSEFEIFIAENRHKDPVIQQAYDKEFGLRLV